MSVNIKRALYYALLFAGLTLGGRCIEAKWPGSGVSEMRADANAAGVLRAALGNFRRLVADGFWLRADMAWEAQDIDRTTRALHSTLLLAPDTRYFVINAARIMAYDLAAWRVAGNEAPARIVRAEQAEAALEILDAGRVRWPEDPWLWIETGNIHLQLTGDLGAASEAFGRAAQLPGGPAVARRIHARLLAQLELQRTE